MSNLTTDQRNEVNGLSDAERRSYYAYRAHGRDHDDAVRCVVRDTSAAILTALRNAWRERTALAETAEAHEAIQFAANAAAELHPGETSGWYATALNVHTVEERHRMNLPAERS